MDQRWRELGNTSNPALQANWRQICSVLNTKLQEFETGDWGRWHTLCPQTGTGKTEGAILYAAMLTECSPDEDHPGVLLVSPFKVEADRIAEGINRHFDYPAAAALHADRPSVGIPHCEIKTLVITHEKYRRIIREALLGNRKGFDEFFRCENRSNERRLVIIDESIELVKHRLVTHDKLSILGSLFSPAVRSKVKKHKTIQTHKGLMDGCEYIEHLRETLEYESGQSLPTKLWEYRPPGLIAGLGKTGKPLQSLRTALRGFAYDKYISNVSDQQHNRLLRERVNEYLDEVESLFWSSSIVGKTSGKERVLISTEFLKPINARGCVVLDATSALDITNFLDSRVIQHPRVANARSYSNVKLHISRSYSPSKSVMKNYGAKVADTVMTSLVQLADRSNSILLITHKNALKHFAGRPTEFEFHVGGWGNVAGKNEWQDCDTVVICSVPFRDPIESESTYIALQGDDESKWSVEPDGVRNPDLETLDSYHRDVISSIWFQPVIVDVIQAINRARCRRVIDSEGNCKTTDVFIVLPSGKFGDEMLRRLEEEMPGIKSSYWSLPGLVDEARPRSVTQGALISWAETAAPGTYKSTSVATELNINKPTLRRFLNRLAKRPRDDLHMELDQQGVHIFKDGSFWMFQKRNN